MHDFGRAIEGRAISSLDFLVQTSVGSLAPLGKVIVEVWPSVFGQQIHSKNELVKTLLD